MTVASDVKQCLSSVKSAESGLARLKEHAEDEEMKAIFTETMTTMSEIIEDLKKRVGKLELEEEQYKGF
ncbi:hypothetical protein GCM10011351_26470 [Paraliobacillus quinghaiensis]|uniref:DUF1657 domain-containing protein n=1 Tax=Paraliobacillus quinghaiensis TaxID=470815 RepID=A0A917TW70_9BACI|nr:DUF1657 domain-containing protein [Paraliobacillus quinghaiensis]GGM39022.1 hypothetical protein GCM10011351_26470 [Paraliobacillus quinghaiensis]